MLSNCFSFNVKVHWRIQFAELYAAETPLAREIPNDLRLVIEERATMVETPTMMDVLLCSVDFAGIYAKQKAMEIRL